MYPVSVGITLAIDMLHGAKHVSNHISLHKIYGLALHHLRARNACIAGKQVLMVVSHVMDTNFCVASNKCCRLLALIIPLIMFLSF